MTSPPALSTFIAAWKVRHGSVTEQGLESLPWPETKLRWTPAEAGIDANDLRMKQTLAAVNALLGVHGAALEHAAAVTQAQQPPSTSVAPDPNAAPQGAPQQ